MRHVVVIEWKLRGGVAVGATVGIVATTLGTGVGAGALEAAGISLRAVVDMAVGATLRSGTGGGGSVGSGGTIVIGAGAGGRAVAVIVGELLSHSGEGVMMGTVGDAGMSVGSSTGGSIGT
jgi:hypothetical protein